MIPDFYSLRDQRTIEYGVQTLFDHPVEVALGAAAANTLAGQDAALALINQLARIHRTIRVCIPPAALLRPPLVPSANLANAICRLARAIDPFIEIEPGALNCPPATLAVRAEGHKTWFIGATGAVARLSRLPADIVDECFSLGACLASCLAASAMLRELLGRSVAPTEISAWDLTEGPGASAGPTRLGPLSIGSVLQVGAGGVGSCFDYWLSLLGAEGHWSILDGDDAELSNTNRSMGMLARDAGWPVSKARGKAEIAAALVSARPIRCWFDEWAPDFRPDLILPLANGRGIRSAISVRGDPLVLHASTSRAWEAQLHRHLPDVDDCLNCRLPPQVDPTFHCSTVQLGTRSPQNDAALPFLSAAAGLLLLSSLIRLQQGEVALGRENFWAINFDTARRYGRSAVWSCATGCATALPAGVRARLHAGTLWSQLDRFAWVDASPAADHRPPAGI